MQTGPKIHYYTDADNIQWKIWRESLPKKIRNGRWNFWIAETLDGKKALRENSQRECINSINKLYLAGSQNSLNFEF